MCRIQPLAGGWLVDSHSIHTNPHRHRPRQHPMSECAPLPSLSLASAGESASEIHHTRRVTILPQSTVYLFSVEKFSLARAVAAPPFF